MLNNNNKKIGVRNINPQLVTPFLVEEKQPWSFLVKNGVHIYQIHTKTSLRIQRNVKTYYANTKA